MKLTIMTPDHVEYEHSLPPWFASEMADLLSGKLIELIVQEEIRRGWPVRFKFTRERTDDDTA